jgi:hypothetical protein
VWLSKWRCYFHAQLHIVSFTFHHYFQLTLLCGDAWSLLCGIHVHVDNRDGSVTLITFCMPYI